MLAPRRRERGSAANNTRVESAVAWLTPSWDVLVYGGSCLFALVTILASRTTTYRFWASIAVGPYLGAALIALSMARRRTGMTGRVALAVITFVFVAIIPLALEAEAATDAGVNGHAQPEVYVTEDAAGTLLGEHDPYSPRGAVSAVGPRAQGLATYFPYPPGMLVFGMPHVMEPESPWTDSRVAFTLVAALAVCAGLLVWRGPPESRLRAFQVLAVAPMGAMLVSTGEDDVPVVALSFLALVLLEERKPQWGALVLGVAAAMKQTAWPLALFFFGAVWWSDKGTRPRPYGAILGPVVPLLAIAPFFAWNPKGFVENILRFPLDLGHQPSPAAMSTLGSALIDLAPSERPIITWFIVCVVLGLAVFLLIHYRSRSAAEIAWACGLFLATAMFLAPASRPGYAIYPINLIVWSRLLGPGERSISLGPALANGPAARMTV